MQFERHKCVHLFPARLLRGLVIEVVQLKWLGFSRPFELALVSRACNSLMAQAEGDPALMQTGSSHRLQLGRQLRKSVCLSRSRRSPVTNIML